MLIRSRRIIKDSSPNLSLIRRFVSAGNNLNDSLNIGSFIPAEIATYRLPASKNLSRFHISANSLMTNSETLPELVFMMLLAAVFDKAMIPSVARFMTRRATSSDMI